MHNIHNVTEKSLFSVCRSRVFQLAITNDQSQCDSTRLRQSSKNPASTTILYLVTHRDIHEVEFEPYLAEGFQFKSIGESSSTAIHVVSIYQYNLKNENGISV